MSSSVTVSSLIGDISQYATNPSPIQRRMIQAFKAIHDNQIEIVDATNAWAFALEASAVNTAIAVQEAQALTRKQYPAAATTYADLYMHMSDTDYVNMFAIPTNATFNIMVQKAQLLNALVYDAATGISQVTIPRNTVINAASVPFSLQYPINIRQLQHGGLQAVYDASVTSPLQTLDTNVLELEEVRGPDGLDYVRFSFGMQQFNIVTLTNDVNSAGGFTTSVTFEDQFYYCRVYSQQTNGTWREINTTYTEQVYDPQTPTAVLQVQGKQLLCTIPVVYTTTGLIRGKIRIDVYQTRGPMSVYMGNYAPTDFTATWLYLDQNDATQAVAALAKLTNLMVWSTDTTLGGRAALTFDQMRARVLDNSIGPRKVPITSAQMQAMLTDDGYTIVKNVDTITDRLFLATKALPSPTEASSKDTNTFTPAAATIITLVSTMDQDLQAYGVTGHETGITITSKALFQTTNGKTGLVSRNQYAQLTALSLTDQAKALNGGTYAFSPFYYVLDNTSEIFYVRPYFLDSPSIRARSFVQENATTGLQASIGANYSVAKTSTGYRVAITTKSNDAYQALPDSEVFCQLSFTSSAQATPVYLNGVQQTRANDSGERTFLFDITTNYDVNESDALALTSFVQEGSTKSPRCDLTQTFQVLFGTTTALPSTFTASPIDQMLGLFMLGSGAVGVTQEQLSVVFGSPLVNLWNNYRSFASEIPYQTYDADVPATYPKDVYQTDAATGSIFSVVNGQIVYNKLHTAGDPILDIAGNPTYLHRAGDYIIDPSTKLPIPLTGYKTALKRSLDIFAIDAVYAFANDPITTTYVSYVKNALRVWLTKDLISLNEKALEKTSISFYPKIAKGVVNVRVNNNVQETIEAAQSLSLTLYVTKDVYLNSSLRTSLETTTLKTLGAYLAENTTISTSGALEALRSVYGSDVVDVSIAGLGGYPSDVVITLIDSSTQFSISKALTVQANNQMAVKESMLIDFKVHDVSSY